MLCNAGCLGTSAPRDSCGALQACTCGCFPGGNQDRPCSACMPGLRARLVICLQAVVAPAFGAWSWHHYADMWCYQLDLTTPMTSCSRRASATLCDSLFAGLPNMPQTSSSTYRFTDGPLRMEATFCSPSFNANCCLTLNALTHRTRHRASCLPAGTQRAAASTGNVMGHLVQSSVPRHCEFACLICLPTALLTEPWLDRVMTHYV